MASSKRVKIHVPGDAGRKETLELGPQREKTASQVGSRWVGNPANDGSGPHGLDEAHDVGPGPRVALALSQTGSEQIIKEGNWRFVLDETLIDAICPRHRHRERRSASPGERLGDKVFRSDSVRGLDKHSTCYVRATTYRI